VQAWPAPDIVSEPSGSLDLTRSTYKQWKKRAAAGVCAMALTLRNPSGAIVRFGYAFQTGLAEAGLPESASAAMLSINRGESLRHSPIRDSRLQPGIFRFQSQKVKK